MKYRWKICAAAVLLALVAIAGARVYPYFSGDLAFPRLIHTLAPESPQWAQCVTVTAKAPWNAEAAEGARRNRDLYFDLAGSSLIKEENGLGIWLQYLWWTDAVGRLLTPFDARSAFETIVFGTDEGPDGFEDKIRRSNKVLDACNVPHSTRAKMYKLTMARILGIKVN